jgi:serine protease Do
MMAMRTVTLLSSAIASLAVAFVVFTQVTPTSQAGATPPQAVSDQNTQDATAPAARVQTAQLLDPPAIERVLPTDQAGLMQSFSPIVRTVGPAVVNVYAQKVVQEARSPFAGDPFFEGFFGNPQPRVANSLGSGVVVGAEGVIVTNAHVISGFDQFRVVLSDRREFPAELVLADERTDLAVLKIDTKGEVLPVLQLATTRGLEVGDIVLAIGNPFGVGQTVTSGIISALARTDVGVSDYAFFIQTDAAINPGNSGGALIDMNGRLVGVNTAIFSRSGGSNGIGFAIPSEMVRRVVDAALNEGRIVRPWLGLKGQTVTSDIAGSLGLDRPVGVLVTEVYPEGPAALSGLKRGDLVLSIDGQEVFDERGLKFHAALKKPGETVGLQISRAGNARPVSVVLAPPPGATEAELLLLEGSHPLSGAEVAELSPALNEEMGRDPFQTGMLVTRMVRNSFAARFGLRPGDVVLSVNGQGVSNAGALQTALSKAPSNRVWSIEIDRNGRKISAQTRL